MYRVFLLKFTITSFKIINPITIETNICLILSLYVTQHALPTQRRARNSVEMYLRPLIDGKLTGSSVIFIYLIFNKAIYIERQVPNGFYNDPQRYKSSLSVFKAVESVERAKWPCVIGACEAVFSERGGHVGACAQLARSLTPCAAI